MWLRGVIRNTILLLLAFAANAHVFLDEQTLRFSDSHIQAEQNFFNRGSAGILLQSVAYFDFFDTAWKDDLVIFGKVRLFSTDFLQSALTLPEYLLQDTPESPNILLADLKSTAMTNITYAATYLNFDFVILILDDAEKKDSRRFWWSQKIPGVPYSTLAQKKPPYFLAVSSEDGNFLASLLQGMKGKGSLHGKPNEQYPCLQIGIDDISPMTGKILMAKSFFYLVFAFILFRWFSNGSKQTHRFTANELGQGEIQKGASHECAICLETMPAGTMVRILPCRHVYHHDCINRWMKEDKDSCPMCKFDLEAHFQEQRAAADVIHNKSCRSICARRLFGSRRINDADESQLLDVEGEDDLELVEEASTNSEEGVVV